ncbi:MAG TPA: preprotein translocase subunit SecE [Rudaea sp.]|nr:preprotein translocase subunit SecE [Rudaea sp.]
MNAKVEQASGASATDKLKLTLAVLVIAAGVVAYYWFNSFPTWQRLLMLLGSFVVGGAIGYFTRSGHALADYFNETIFEMRKVVWPTRQETIQTTLVIIVVVIILSILLGLIDVFLNWAILQNLLKMGR